MVGRTWLGPKTAREMELMEDIGSDRDVGSSKKIPSSATGHKHKRVPWLCRAESLTAKFIIIRIPSCCGGTIHSGQVASQCQAVR